MSVIDEAKAKIKDRGLKLVMPEGEDARIRAAAERFRRAAHSLTRFSDSDR